MCTLHACRVAFLVIYRETREPAAIFNVILIFQAVLVNAGNLFRARVKVRRRSVSIRRPSASQLFPPLAERSVEIARAPSLAGEGAINFDIKILIARYFHYAGHDNHRGDIDNNNGVFVLRKHIVQRPRATGGLKIESTGTGDGEEEID